LILTNEVIWTLYWLRVSPLSARDSCRDAGAITVPGAEPISKSSFEWQSRRKCFQSWWRAIQCQLMTSLHFIAKQVCPCSFTFLQYLVTSQGVSPLHCGVRGVATAHSSQPYRATYSAGLGIHCHLLVSRSRIQSMRPRNVFYKPNVLRNLQKCSLRRHR
jgi:hypothetical protein